MKKIPTLFVRDSINRSLVTSEVTSGCEWVLAGEGDATRKYDGTCVMFDGHDWWARREVKSGKPTPSEFIVAEHDVKTGKTVGWEPAGQSGFIRWLEEAVGAVDDWEVGTYELCGPKINGNPEACSGHVLVPHRYAQLIPLAYPLDFEGLRHRLTTDWPYEGIVWHHPDGRMAKLKRRDFGHVGDAT